MTMILPRVDLTWDESTEPLNTFLRYQVYRREVGQTSWTKIKRITGRSINYYSDYLVVTGITFEYSVTVVKDVSGEEVESAHPTPVQAAISFEGTYLHDVASPAYYVFIPTQGVSTSTKPDIAFVEPWGKTEPIAHVGQRTQRSMNVGLRWYSGDLTWETIETLQQRQASSGALMCYRDRRGTKTFCIIEGIEKTDEKGPIFSGRINLRRVSYSEVVS